MVVRGVPKGLAKDAWWLDDAGKVEQPAWLRGALLLFIVGLADQLIWATSGGLGVVVWVLAIAAAAQITLGQGVAWKRGIVAWGLLIVSLLPAIELIQPLSVMFAVLGLSAFAVILALGRKDAPVILHAMMRLPVFGVLQTWRDARAVRVAVPTAAAVKDGLRDWVLPLGVGCVFIALMAAANPLVDQWLLNATHFDAGISLNVGRIMFWIAGALVVWPFLRLALLAAPLGRPILSRSFIWHSVLLNDRSVMRALVMFNVIFAVQTFLDVGYLWGGVALPDGMTYADYAHRGAYPLLATALLAGLFALMSQPFLAQRPILRGLLYLWVAQTVLLVVSSILRLDLYVDAYGLTRLRFAAFLWMVVVALGLVLMIVQMVGRQDVGWFTLRAAGLGLVTLYGASLVNVDGLIARTNLAREKPDLAYICDLGEGAFAATFASGHCLQNVVSTPADWREWGYRNARLRNSLATMNKEVQP